MTHFRCKKRRFFCFVGSLRSENVAQATKDALADMKAETTKAIELFLDETGNIKKKPQPLINSKAKLVSNALKTFDHVERLWYMCGTASRGKILFNHFY